MGLSQEEMERILTPPKEEQTFRILQNKCPHNNGWLHDGHGHNDDAYVCLKCGEIKWW